MPFDLSVETTEFSQEDLTWLGSAFGTDDADSGTLDASLFLATFTDGKVPSGVTLGRITASPKRYGPYDDTATDGREVMQGHLLVSTDLQGTTAATAKDKVVALMWHGQIIEANLPTGHGLDAAGKADVGERFHYV